MMAANEREANQQTALQRLSAEGRRIIQENNNEPVTLMFDESVVRLRNAYNGRNSTTEPPNLHPQFRTRDV